jgi:hypothetical protein
MGTPVIGFDIPPLNEYVIKENSLLAPVQVRYDNKGNPILSPDIPKLESSVTGFLKQPYLLQRFKKHTSDWVKERAKLFNSGWKEVFLK